MVEWKYINDIIVSLKTGLNPRQNFRLNTPESFFPYITGKDIYNNKINVTSVTDKVDSKAVVLINKRANLEDNLLLFASTGTGTVGRMAIVAKYESDWAISETLYAIKTSNVISPQFLMYSLYSDIAKKQYEPKISKGSVPHLKIADLLKVKIPVPALYEQRRIVEQLDTFTSSIENLKEQIAQRRKQYEYYRDQLLDLEGKEGVEMKTLGEVVSKECSLSYGIVQPGDDVPNGIPVVRPIDLVSMFVEKEGLKKTTKEISDSYKRTILKGNEILFCVRGTTGVMSLASEMLKDCNVTRGIVPITIDDKITKMFVYYQLKGLRLQKTIAEKTNGTALRQINVKDLRLLSLMLPPLSEQQRIVSILDTFEASIANLEAQLSQREKQYEYYRNKLLTFE